MEYIKVLIWFSSDFPLSSDDCQNSLIHFRPVICVGEVEWLWGWDLVRSHRIPLLTPCNVCDSITTAFKQNVPIYIYINHKYDYYNSSTKCKVQGILESCPSTDV